MDPHCHGLLASLDEAEATTYSAALAEWRRGSFTTWQAAVREALRKGESAPVRPAPPSPPLSPRLVVFNLAALHGVSVEDLVRHARGSEVRTVYTPGALEQASAALGDGIRTMLKSLAWPALPPLPAPSEEPEVEQAGQRNDPLDAEVTASRGEIDPACHCDTPPGERGPS